jgi:very-short-patch-repair endonuclease
MGIKSTERAKNKEVRARMSAIGKQLWKNPEFVKKVQYSLQLKPNKPETIILNILNSTSPNEWKYTGDFSFMINGKNPDFVNCNGQKKIIELYGDYWHKGDSEQNRIDTFAPFGYQTLIIWEKELKNINKVINKITTFCDGISR